MRQFTHPLSFNLRVIPGVTAMFAQGELPQRLAEAKAHGFSGVEAAAPEQPDTLRRMLDDHDMTFVCMSVGRGPEPGDAFGMAALPARRAAFRSALLEGIACASALSCRMIHVVGGLVPPEQREACR